MADLAMLDRAFYNIMQGFIKDGRAPHYTELAKALGVSMEGGREILHDLVNTGYPMGLVPDTDYVLSCAPFSNLPNHCRISVEGEQKWYAQWGLEGLVVRWLFPGKMVRFETTCLDCGDPLVIAMRDEEVLSAEPAGIIGYSNSPIGVFGAGRDFRWAGMNLFRSEEHARNWSGFRPDYVENLQPLSYWLYRFSLDAHRRRGRPDYISWFVATRVTQQREIRAYRRRWPV